MNILHIVQRYHPAIGGSELYMKQLSEYLAKSHNVTVLTTNVRYAQDFWKVGSDVSSIDKRQEKINGVKVIRLETDPYFLKPAIVTKVFRKLLSSLDINLLIRSIFDVPTSEGMLNFITKSNRSRFDIVHVSAMPYGHLFYVGHKIARRDNAKFFMTPFIHLGADKDDGIRDNYFRKYYQKFYLDANKVFVQTDAEKRGLIKFLKEASSRSVDERKFIKIGLGLDAGEQKNYKSSVFRNRYNLKYPIVFYVGTQSFDKGAITLIKAMDILWKKGRKLHLVLAGSETEGFAKFFKNFANKEKILYLGEISDEKKQQLFSSGDVFCMVSRNESFGIVYLESWHHGKPVIACDTFISREIISDQKDGLLCKFADEMQLAGQIEHLIDNPNLARKMGKAGLEKVKADYLLGDKLKVIAKYYNID